MTHLVERRTGMPLTQVQFIGTAREFAPRVIFQCRLSYMSVHPRVQSHALTFVHTLKILDRMYE